jgi:hypothetical protein
VKVCYYLFKNLGDEVIFSNLNLVILKIFAKMKENVSN